MAGLPAEPGALELAVERARLAPDLAELPAGLDTVIGRRGVRLSGGQVQRVAAARAFVRQPDLLVVDDLSSALDAHTEQALWGGLAGWRSLTVLAVSHRVRPPPGGPGRRAPRRPRRSGGRPARAPGDVTGASPAVDRRRVIEGRDS